MGMITVVTDVAPRAGAWIEALALSALPSFLRSLPVRERGLKLPILARPHGQHVSLPVRERGLKQLVRWHCRNDAVSLPVRERGLKHHRHVRNNNHITVAPRAGAWIEARCKRLSSALTTVAPRAGAWIEAMASLARCLMRGRSLPVRERGLKRKIKEEAKQAKQSLPVRERGLKRFWENNETGVTLVAPRAGAWIEALRDVIYAHG